MGNGEGVIRLLTLLAAGLVLGGCSGATMIKPNQLEAPAKLTCIELPVGLQAHEAKGLLKIRWTTRLQPGAYVSEREDALGTYYRAPPGGIEFVQDGKEDKPASPLTHMAYDGGIWVAHDPSTPPHLYTYFSTGSVAPVPGAGDATCANTTVTRDPVTKRINTVAVVAGGALGGAVGGAVARSAAKGSYGQAVGVGAAGGALGSLVVAALINKDVGKIMEQPVATDPAFVAALQRAVKHPMPIREAQ